MEKTPNTSAAWFVPEGKPLALREDLVDVLKGLDGQTPREIRRAIPEASDGYGWGDGESEVESSNPEVAVVKLIGPITQYTGVCDWMFGGCSLESFMHEMQEAFMDPAISAIVMLVDSPGGEAAGNADAADLIREMSKTKPVVSCITGDGCSAAYWLSAAATESIASQTAIVGSIGCAILCVDTKEADKMAGIRRIEVVSSVSPKKRMDPATDGGRKQIQELANSFGDIFVAKVAEFRGVSIDTVLNDFGQGGVLVGADAQAAGLVDRIGTLDDAIQRAAELAGAASSSTTGAQLPPTARGSLATGGTPMTAAEFLAAHPAAAAEIEATGAAKERNRISAILKLNTQANLAVAGEQIKAAIEDGKTQAGDLALQILEAHDKRREAVAKDRQNDSDELPVIPAGDPEGLHKTSATKLINTADVYSRLNGGK